MKHKFLKGDFNQVEDHADKLGGDKGTIFGAKFFSEWKTRNLLADIAYKGPKFTWCNNRFGSARIYERLDKGLISSNWYSFFPNTGLLHLPIQCSDHAPIIMDTELLSIHRQRSFKMEAWCFDYDDCLVILKKEWFKYDKGSASYSLLRKLKRIRGIFKQWTFQKRREWNKKWTDFDEQLGDELQEIFQGKSEHDYEVYHTQYLEFNKAASLFWKQRAKINWIREGDACTKYFFNSVRERYKRNYIFGLRQDDGEWCFTQNGIASLFRKYFEDIYESSVTHDCFEDYLQQYDHVFQKIRSKISNDQHDILAKKFTRKEVRAAVFQMGPTKSPGPDGIPALFFQRYWFHIKNEVTDSVLAMLNTGNILKEFNRTSISLIPKTDCPEKVEQFRPISLCNVVMRIVSKCIANRIKRIMPDLVGQYQNGFVPGRSITDNILISHELFHYISTKKTGKNGVMALKVDMSKAYDRLRWNFIQATLLHMGFPSHIISLIMNTIQTVSYEIIINGTPGNALRPKTGIRQGDPLSPYLFALSTEVLSQLLLHAQTLQKLQGIRVCRNAPAVSHLLFADDSIFFSQANSGNAIVLRHILDLYCKCSGQKLNEAKSAITFSPNCTLQDSKDCLKLLRVSGGNRMGSYLGLPTDFGSSKKEIFALVFEKVRKRILSWNNNFLSAAGRLTLICSVLSSLSIYSLSAFKMPVSVISKIDSLLSQFWWSGCKAGKGIHWSSRLFIQSVKSHGGLGIRNLGCLNLCLLAKVGWRILSKTDTLISQVLGSKYQITPSSFMNSAPEPTAPMSWGGRGIRWGLSLLVDNLSWQVGFPSTLDIWKDKWIHGASLGLLSSLDADAVLHKPSMEVSILQTVDGEWDYDKVLQLCGTDVLPLVLSTAIPPLDEADTIVWNLTSNGEYSIKSGYALAFDKLWNSKASLKDRTRMEPTSVRFCKKIWQLPLQNKWKIFLWRLFSNSLPCGEEFRRRNFPGDHFCLFCRAQTPVSETLRHLFRDCSSVSRIWAACPLGIRSFVGNNVSIQQWIINWILLLMKSTDPLYSISLFVSTLWHIWCLRNRVLFRNEAMDFRVLFKLIMVDATNNELVERKKETAKGVLSATHPDDMDGALLLRHHFPHPLIGPSVCSDHVRLKCDASWKTNFKTTAGWLFQNKHGVIFRTGCKNFWAKNALQAEAMALKFACYKAISLGFYHLDAASDCLNLVLQLNGYGTTNQDVLPILNSISLLVSTCHCFSLSHCPRNLNRIAHALAKAIA
ncbi:uncharacterized protein LOC141590805 [Silene latifolia]|uniref:uncharacterized protein LOC141590805 n=1 Tax=Silene latifolia TaxID=37657 RepID=UPI003D76C9D4